MAASRALCRVARTEVGHVCSQWHQTAEDGCPGCTGSWAYGMCAWGLLIRGIMQATCASPDLVQEIAGLTTPSLHICAHCDSASEGACREGSALSSLMGCRSCTLLPQVHCSARATACRHLTSRPPAALTTRPQGPGGKQHRHDGAVHA